MGAPQGSKPSGRESASKSRYVIASTTICEIAIDLINGLTANDNADEASSTTAGPSNPFRTSVQQAANTGEKQTANTASEQKFPHFTAGSDWGKNFGGPGSGQSKFGFTSGFAAPSLFATEHNRTVVGHVLTPIATRC